MGSQVKVGAGLIHKVSSNGRLRDSMNNILVCGQFKLDLLQEPISHSFQSISLSQHVLQGGILSHFLFSLLWL